MTREEIEELKGLAASMGLYDDKNPCKRAVVLGKAIKALEQEPTTKNDLAVDCISREQAKEAIRDKFKDLPSRVEINTILNELPSLTPQEPVLDKIRAEIAEYGSIMVSYAITKDTKTDKGIEKLVSGVLKQAKEQVLEIIDKYKAESEPQESEG